MGPLSNAEAKNIVIDTFGHGNFNEEAMQVYNAGKRRRIESSPSKLSLDYVY